VDYNARTPVGPGCGLALSTMSGCERQLAASLIGQYSDHRPRVLSRTPSSEHEASDLLLPPELRHDPLDRREGDQKHVLTIWNGEA